MNHLHVTKFIRYLANLVLLISLFFFISNWIVEGIDVFSLPIFWLILIALWQVVIMLILTENFYVIKKKK